MQIVREFCESCLIVFTFSLSTDSYCVRACVRACVCVCERESYTIRIQFYNTHKRACMHARTHARTVHDFERKINQAFRLCYQIALRF